ncbi:MAG: GLPGLI family protein [Calothrix sp. SM1_7_51]|nr:GLPGLI family protein [Calothrix sp. SM1_7_51]
MNLKFFNMVLVKSIKLIFLLLLIHVIALAQDSSLRIIYENEDAYDGLKRNPSIGVYLTKVGETSPPKGKERSSLRLYRHTAIYTIDSVYVMKLGYRQKSWTYSIVNIRDLTTSQRFTVYSNLTGNFAYVEKCKEKINWEIDKSKTKTILGMKCYFASTEIQKNRHQIWFTNELPYQEGPFASDRNQGCNLPGLVWSILWGMVTPQKRLILTLSPIVQNWKQK